MREELAALVGAAVEQVARERGLDWRPDPATLIEACRDERFGDFTANAAMELASRASGGGRREEDPPARAGPGHPRRPPRRGGAHRESRDRGPRLHQLHPAAGALAGGAGGDRRAGPGLRALAARPGAARPGRVRQRQPHRPPPPRPRARGGGRRHPLPHPRGHRARGLARVLHQRRRAAGRDPRALGPRPLPRAARRPGRLPRGRVQGRVRPRSGARGRRPARRGAADPPR